MVGSKKHTINIRKGTTVEQLKQKLVYIHLGRKITGIASEGVQIAGKIQLKIGSSARREFH
jgi:hypothetical protein